MNGRPVVPLTPSAAGEFDTRIAHWFGSGDSRAVEVLSLFGRHGEQVHVTAKSEQR